jgi:dTDP-4-amino-4,6-dideoxygalactose transaminase
MTPPMPLACSHNGRLIGNFGAAEVFSFHATKFFNTFEGGAVTTNDDALAEKLRLMQNFGFERLDTVTYIGVNGKMSEISAAMGLTGLESLDEFLAANQTNYRLYQDYLDDIPGLSLYQYKPDERNNHQYIVLEIDEEVSGLSRDRLVTLLHAEQVRARRYFYPACHKMEPYRSYFPHAGLLLPHTERLVERVMTLPTGTAVSPTDVQHICHLIRFMLQNASAINQQWDASLQP